MNGSSQFSLLDELQSKNSIVDPAALIQGKAEAAWISGRNIRLNNKTIY